MNNKNIAYKDQNQIVYNIAMFYKPCGQQGYKNLNRD